MVKPCRRGTHERCRAGHGLGGVNQLITSARSRIKHRGTWLSVFCGPWGMASRLGRTQRGRSVQKSKPNAMRPETIAVHGGYDPEAAHRAVAVPIYQTVAYAFDSAEHGAALFNLEVEGHRYSRISNPTTSVLEKRVAELEDGV